jgi:hypothetical protein
MSLFVFDVSLFVFDDCISHGWELKREGPMVSVFLVWRRIPVGYVTNAQ